MRRVTLCLPAVTGIVMMGIPTPVSSAQRPVVKSVAFLSASNDSAQPASLTVIQVVDQFGVASRPCLQLRGLPGGVWPTEEAIWLTLLEQPSHRGCGFGVKAKVVPSAE